MFTRQEINEVFKSFEGLKVMIIGDVMIDSYLWGKVDRISPEAPVPVVSLTHRENRPGGAANVALNIQSLGAVPLLCSVIGNDSRADQFMDLMKENHLPGDGIFRSNDRLTTTKFRVIGNNSHMLRVDEETDCLLDENENQELFSRISSIIREGVDVIIFEDYDKGVISEEMIRKVAELAREKNIPVTVDPKKKNFNSYTGISLFKPNLKELREGLHLEINVQKEELERVIPALIMDRGIDIVLVTLSEAGMFVCYHEDDDTIRAEVIPAHLRNIADVSGAGDTVISVASLGLALGLNPLKIAALANLAGGLVCEEVGVVSVSKQKLLNDAYKYLAVS
jgi:D-glycero-beta-D-manno-heptose-7-phosphate kinase